MDARKFVSGLGGLSGLLIAFFAASTAAASFDWYRWRGPDLNGISQERDWADAWPATGPKALWKASVGTGFSAISVANGRAYTMGNREGQETVYCLDAVTGNSLWNHTYDCAIDPHYYEGGPSSTPTADGDRLYTLSRKGHLFCFESATGKVIWQKNVNEELGLKAKESTPEWGYASSPLVQGNLLVLNVGTAGSALDKRSGKVIWTTGKHCPGYATPVPFEVDHATCLAVFGARAIYAIALQDGRKLWEYPWVTGYDVNAADPILRGDQVFISTGYDHGSALLEFKGGQVRKIWESKTMRNHLNSSVLLEGHLYGMDGDNGRKGSILHCIEFETGKLKWAEPSVQPGGLMAAAGRLIILSQSGQLVIAKVSPQAFQPLARAQVLGGKCWTVPVLSHGRIYGRNSRGDVVCLDVAGKATTQASQP